MQEVQVLRLENLERFTSTLVDGQTATLKTLQQNANYIEEFSAKLDILSESVQDNTKRIDEVSTRVDEISTKLDQVEMKLDSNSRRLDSLESMVGRVLDELANINAKLDSRGMGFAPSQ